MKERRTDRERLEAIQVSTIAADDAVVLGRDDFVWLCERALARASGMARSERVMEAEAPAAPAGEPGQVAPCCHTNIEHEVFRLIPIPGVENVVGEGTLSVKSRTTGRYVPVYCCGFCS